MLLPTAKSFSEKTVFKGEQIAQGTFQKRRERRSIMLFLQPRRSGQIADPWRGSARMLGGGGGGVRSSNPKHSKAPQASKMGGVSFCSGNKRRSPTAHVHTKSTHSPPPPHLLSGGGRCSGLTPRTQDGSQKHKIVANLVPVKSEWREGTERHDKAGTQRAAPCHSSSASAPPPQLPPPHAPQGRTYGSALKSAARSSK